MDTIVAVSTGAVQGAVSLLRLSGSKALEIAQQLFYHYTEGVRTHWDTPRARYLYHLYAFTATGGLLDDPLVVYFAAPHSYTGEDVVEVSCHASIFIVQTLLQQAIAAGARLAERGEFTQRAFLHGKLSLTQAEAIPDLLAALTPTQHALALKQKEGAIASAIKPLRDELLHLLTLLELELDFSEEDVEFASRDELHTLIQQLDTHLEKLEQSYAKGRAVREGVRIVFVGTPNVGKSSLLNTLLGKERAIVTDVPGTTRDTIEAPLLLGDCHFLLTDTAGIRTTDDAVEKLGIARTYEALQEAHAIVLLIDSAALYRNADTSTVESKLQEHLTLLVNPTQEHETLEEIPQLVLFTKVDLLNSEQHTQITHWKSIIQTHAPEITVLPYSIYQAALHDALIEWLQGVGLALLPHEEETVLSNPRHYQALRKACMEMHTLRTVMTEGAYPEIVAHHIHRICHHLDTITGAITTEEVLGNIFQHFCIGK